MFVVHRADYAPDRRRPPYPSTQTAPAPHLSIPTNSVSPLRGLAHKHAHHLHSIPPREKSTRTLIIDHMLWVHGRTRFAQARAELGMTDRTGGPSAPNYVHRKRPENYDEDEEADSEGEDVIKIKARPADPPRPLMDDEDRRSTSRDLLLARTLRLRAEGLEKVVTAMLGQPPPVHAIEDGGILTPPTSPKGNSSTSPSHSTHPHVLPNGVRLRLALGTIINDLFSRQAPSPPYRHQFQTSQTPSEHSPSEHAIPNHPEDFPPALSVLSTVSAGNSRSGVPYSPGSKSTPSIFPGAGFPSHSGRGGQSQRYPTPSARTRTLYKTGASPAVTNTPPFHCPRHLYPQCEICVAVPTPARQGARDRGRSVSTSDFVAGNPWKGMPGGVGPGGGGISGWRDGPGIGSGLLRSGIDGTVLRRKINSGDFDEVFFSSLSSARGGNTQLSNLIPRFIKLSALVAVEMAMEAQDEEDAKALMAKEGAVWPQMRMMNMTPPVSPTNPRASPRMSPVVSRPQVKTYDYAAYLPTREWYLILAGLLTRAALEGYLTAGWRGFEPAECLLTVGLGIKNDSNPETHSGFEEFDPDELPSLTEAMKILFPSSKPLAPPGKSKAEQEYEHEMHERLHMFYDIPVSTPDLSKHMEDLAWKFPAEPVERAALRFCEAISRWRGKPELESRSIPTTMMHSKNPAVPVQASATAASASANGYNTSRRKPLIDVYFKRPSPPSIREDPWTWQKRQRPFDEVQQGPSKRIHL